MQTVELEFWEAMLKLEERLRFITIQVENNQDISEDDYERVLKPCHEMWHDGRLVFHKTAMESEVKSVVQGGLFDKLSDNSSRQGS